MRRLPASLVLALMLISSIPAAAANRPLNPDDISVPRGFRIEVAIKDLAAPTMVAFDDQERMLIAESGYCPDPDRCPNGPGAPKVSRIEPDGKRTVLAEGADFGEEIPVTSVAFHDGKVYVVHAGTISTIEDERLRPIITGIPGQGDHQANELEFHDGFMYVSVGTVTNSGVVGPDNAVFGWLNKPALHDLHDVPCEDVILAGEPFESPNPFKDDPDPLRQLGAKPTVLTSPYSSFGEAKPPGAVIKGDVKCNGAVLRGRPDGSEIEVFAWGFRNPFGLEVGPDGNLYATDHGFDARGSRPIENAWDCFWRVERGRWYGSPDFSCGDPVTDERFRPRDKPQPASILKEAPGEPPRPITKFKPHEASNGFAFAPSRTWGSPTDAFIALFGDMTPGTGVVDRPQGYKVVKVDTRSGKQRDFITNKVEGRPSQQNSGGIEHPSDVTFGPDGAMYITDWGVARVSVDGIVLERNSGVVWKVTPGLGSKGLPVPRIRLIALGGLVLLAIAMFFVARGGERPLSMTAGAVLGAVAGLIFASFAMFVAAPLLGLPWFAPARLMASILMGGGAVQNVLEFDLASFALGAIVVLLLGIILGGLFSLLLRTTVLRWTFVAGLLYGLIVWIAVQYLVFPVVFPLIVDKGFPPAWYAASFAVFGVALGGLTALRVRRSSGL